MKIVKAALERGIERSLQSLIKVEVKDLLKDYPLLEDRLQDEVNVPVSKDTKKAARDLDLAILNTLGKKALTDPMAAVQVYHGIIDRNPRYLKSAAKGSDVDAKQLVKVLQKPVSKLFASIYEDVCNTIEEMIEDAVFEANYAYDAKGNDPTITVKFGSDRLDLDSVLAIWTEAANGDDFVIESDPEWE